MKTIWYRQCVLIKVLKCGYTTQASWIPECYAVIGKQLKLKNNDIWEDGWIVDQIGDKRVAEQNLPDSHAQIKGHRKNTGDSLKKRAV
jgi:hypothetical protein